MLRSAYRDGEADKAGKDEKTEDKPKAPQREVCRLRVVTPYQDFTPAVACSQSLYRGRLAKQVRKDKEDEEKKNEQTRKALAKAEQKLRNDVYTGPFPVEGCRHWSCLRHVLARALQWRI